MNFEVLKQYFAFLAKVEADLQNNRNHLQLHRHNSFIFYKLIATKSQPEIDRNLLINFIKSFTYNFQVKQPNELVDNSNYQLMPSDDNSSQDTLMAKGVDLFLAKWSNSGKLNFQEFSMFLKEQGQMPDKSKQLEYVYKKKFYQLIEDQIQNLLDGETFRRAVNLQYRNLVDLFELMSTDDQITIQSIKNLFLMSGQRKNQSFYQMIAKRFPLPCDQSSFRKWFTVAVNQNKYKQQTKIFYSSLKRKNKETHYDEEDDGRFMTPNHKSVAAVGMSSTKMTKGDRLNSIKRNKVDVSRFSCDQCPQTSQRTQTVILTDILNEEERVNQMKRQLVFRQDYDLQLIYERKGKQFEEILNNRYGSCNFTSFVRFIVPQDFENRYLAFIKYQKESKLSQQTSEMINTIIDQQYNKESAISQWWQELDKQIVFRSYCHPGEKAIRNQQMKKYFTERECKILLDRFDPNKTGCISFEQFN